jgi:hypothetical protein
MSENNIDLDLELIPYKTNNRSHIKKYHIIRKNTHTIKHKICNVFAPFGRQTPTDHKTKHKLEQHRLNICFSKIKIAAESEDKSYIELKRLINELETYFKTFDDLSEHELVSNIINRDEYGIVFRFHLKTNQNKTVTPLIQVSKDNINEKNDSTEWISFDKTKQFNFNFHPDSLWIDNQNKKYGVSLMIDKVFQLI